MNLDLCNLIDRHISKLISIQLYFIGGQIGNSKKGESKYRLKKGISMVYNLFLKGLFYKSTIFRKSDSATKPHYNLGGYIIINCFLAVFILF